MSLIGIAKIVARALVPFMTWASFQRSNFQFTKGKPLEIAWARPRLLALRDVRERANFHEPSRC